MTKKRGGVVPPWRIERIRDRHNRGLPATTNEWCHMSLRPSVFSISYVTKAAQRRFFAVAWSAKSIIGIADRRTRLETCLLFDPAVSRAARCDDPRRTSAAAWKKPRRRHRTFSMDTAGWMRKREGGRTVDVAGLYRPTSPRGLSGINTPAAARYWFTPEGSVLGQLADQRGGLGVHLRCPRRPL